MLSYFNGVIIMHKDGKYIGYIYKILNTINDKLYIGQTTSSIEKRFNDHLSAARTMKSSSMIIIHAINKYGEESFSISEVEKVICDSQEELQNLLNTKEIYYIAYYNSLRPNGYNITKGGNYTSPTTMSKVDQYDYQGNLIFTYDSLEDAKNTISPTAISSTNIGAACKGDSMSAYGYIWRYHGEPFDKYPTHENNYNKIKVDQYDINGNLIKTFDSASDAAKSLNKITKSGKGQSGHIVSCCTGKRNKAYGYVWRYHSEPFDKYSIIPKKNCKKINQYSKNNVFIKTYSSIKEASKETGACETTIIPCCRYKRNYSGGFKWYYADDINQPDKTRIIAA